MTPPKRPLTSRETVFRAPQSPDKRFLPLDKMLQLAFDAGSGLSARKSAQRRKCSPTTPSKIAKRVTKEEVPILGPVPEHEKIYSRQILRHFVVFRLLENPCATGRDIADAAKAKGLKTSKSTVNRLASDMKFTTVTTQKTEKLSDRQKEYRVYFAENVFTWTGFYLPWLFTDETMLVLNPEKRRLRVIRGVEHEDKYVKSVGYPLKLMVWGAISRNFKSPLVRIDGHVTAQVYQTFLTDSGVIEAANAQFGDLAWVFQQDGARPHTAKSTKQFLQQRVLTLPDDLHWPASSPDLSVIENLWAILKRQVDYTRIHDIDSLYQEAARVWGELPLETINNCMRDFDPRLRAVKALNGESLNEHKAVVRAFRKSTAAGEQALRHERAQRSGLAEFCAASRDFFEKDASNYEQSCRICRRLPDSIKRRTGLPDDSLL